MTVPPQLIDSSNRPFTLDRQLASGGEGAVYLLPNDTSRVAKVYHQPPTQQTTDKLITMVGLKNDELLKVAAWPTGLLFTPHPRRVAGFIMPRLSDCHPVQHLYNPVMRLKYFPQASWSFQVRAALNMAAAFDEVHKAGCLVGDVNQSNALVSSQALVRLIDCDSFQVQANGRQYLCEVGVPHYTPPELQGKSFRGLIRTENHDRFGLAVFIYQLLFVGRHPYAGVFHGKGDPSFEELIAQFRFAQGPGSSLSQMTPPPHTPTFADIPSELGRLFSRAFERGSEAGSRPKPNEWISALKELERGIVECSVDPGHRHWKGQSRCVWCRLAEAGGPEYYFGVVGGGGGTFAIDERKLEEVMRRLAAVKDVESAPARAHYRRGLVVAGRALPGRASELKAAWSNALIAAQGVIAAREKVESQEIRVAVEKENRQLAKLETEYQAAEQEWDDEFAETRAAAAERWRDKQRTTAILGVTVGLCLLLLMVGLIFSGTVAIIGGVSIVGFVGWLVVHIAILAWSGPNQHLAELRKEWKETEREFSHRRDDIREDTANVRKAARNSTKQVRQQAEAWAAEAEHIYINSIAAELNQREQRFREAERILTELERTLADRAADARRRQQRTRTEIITNVTHCRELTSEYQLEHNRVQQNAEAVARARYLRVHLIDDADISGVGEKRKRTLIADGVVTAADVTWDRVRSIGGFGDTLTQNVVTWRKSVERTFIFNPNTIANTAEQRALVQRYRTRQSQLVAEINRRLIELESQGHTAHADLEPLLRRAVAEWEQAEADLRVARTPA